MSQSLANISAKQKNIENWIDGINAFNATPGNGTTRHYLTDADWDARMYIKNEMEKLGLSVSMDCMGDLFGTLPGEDPTAAPVWTGSHFDSVLHGGRFDGVAGIVSGLEAVRMIQESGEKHKRNITVVAYSSEETARFGLGCLGSRAMVGKLTLDDLHRLHADDGPSLYDELKRRGLNPEEIDKCRVHNGEVFCSLELHIEQNSVLEHTSTPIGIVKAICAPLNYTVEVSGVAAHAGGMPMTERKDAFAAAAEMSMALEKITRENTNSEYCTGTIGRIALEPNVPTVIPSKASFTVDIRDCDMNSKELLKKAVEEQFAQIAAKRGVGLKMTLHNHDVPAVSDPKIVSLFKTGCDRRGIAYRDIISGPFHDSLFVSEFAPIGMLFVPSKDGLSHCPEEFTEASDITLGAEVLAEVLLELANKNNLT